MKSEWHFRQNNVLEVDSLPYETDLLFIDSFHTGAQLDAELELHAARVKHWIILHDTESSKWVHQPTGLGGLWPTVLRWVGIRDRHQIALVKQPAEWYVAQHYPNNCGLTVLKRIREASPHELDMEIVERARELSRRYFDEQGHWRNAQPITA